MTPTPEVVPIIIAIKDVCTLTSLSRTAINNLRSTGTFPVEVELGTRRIGLFAPRSWLGSRRA